MHAGKSMRYKYLRFRFLYHGTVSSFAISVTIGSEASVSFVAGLRKFMVMLSMNVGVDKPLLVKEIGRLLNFAERGPARREVGVIPCSFQPNYIHG
jgi:hypothetical protein